MTDLWDREAHRTRARREAVAALRDTLRLPPVLTLSQWADRHRIMSPESSAEPGPWRTDRAPYLREIMDTIGGSVYADVTILKCSQSGGTEAINNAVGYYIDQEPSPILVIQPNFQPMALAWSKERLAPMLRDCAVLRGKVKDPRTRDSGNTTTTKRFPGGFLAIIGANAPAGLASRPIRVVLADELDRWGVSAGNEGDPLSLAEARTITYRHRRKLVKVTTPGNEGESRGEKAWKLSDQRHYYVPCPHCGEMQPLEWRDTAGRPDVRVGRGPFRLVWDKSVTEDGEEVHHPETAGYECRACGEKAYDRDKPMMLARGEWRRHNPASKLAGFHISGLLSPWLTWVAIAESWLGKKDDPEQRKVFYNTVLGLLYQEEGDLPDADQLSARRQPYAAEVPDGVHHLTMAVDVQGDRLECEVRGWGPKDESWLIHVERLFGEPAEPALWTDVEAIRLRKWRRADGSTMRVATTMVDSGYLTDVVYRWVRPRQRQRVFAYKGVEGARSPVSRASRANADGVKVVTVNPNALKDLLFRRLKRVTPGPGFLHFGAPEQCGATEEYLRQYGAEKRVVEWKGGQPRARYVKTAPRNEAIDLYVMNLAAHRLLPRHYRDQEAPDAPVAVAVPVPTPAVPETSPSVTDRVIADRLRKMLRPAGGFSIMGW